MKSYLIAAIAVCVLGVTVAWANSGELIRTYEPKVKLARCTVDPQDDSKLYCDNYCQMNNRSTLENLGDENRGWNCDSTTRRMSWMSEWNANNPQNRVTSCDQGSGSVTGFHQGMCDVLEDRITMPAVITVRSYIVWDGQPAVCFNPLLSNSEYAANGCPVQRAYVQFSNDIYNTYSNGSGSANSTWVTSSDPGTSGQTLAERYSMSVSGDTSALSSFTQTNNYLMLEYHDPRPDRNRPGIGQSELETYEIYIMTCEIADPSNCANTQVNFVIGQDHG